MPQFFFDLVTRTDESRRAFETHPVVLDAVARGMPLERYQALLLELYHLVWHFNPTCAAAASRMTDEFASVRYFLYRHMHEESGHEQWVLNDLDAVRVRGDAAIAHVPSVDVLGLNGFNYWSADRRHPCSILGMMYVLEVIASVYGGPFATAVKETLFLADDRGTSFIGSHAEMDAKHMAELRDVLNSIESGDARTSVIESAIVNFHYVTRIFSAI